MPFPRLFLKPVLIVIFIVIFAVAVAVARSASGQDSTAAAAPTPTSTPATPPRDLKSAELKPTDLEPIDLQPDASGTVPAEQIRALLLRAEARGISLMDTRLRGANRLSRPRVLLPQHPSDNEVFVWLRLRS